MNGEPWRRRCLAHEPRDLDAADPIGPDLVGGDPVVRQLPRDEIGGVAEATPGDELAARVLVGSGRQSQIGGRGTFQRHQRAHDHEPT